MGGDGLTLPLEVEKIKSIAFNRMYFLTGTIYTARDRAHRRICEAIASGKDVPFSLEGACIYYCGPSPKMEGSDFQFGSAGPTTSMRMDEWTAPLLERGVKVLIGKGQRSDRVSQLIRKCGAVYFATVGGAGAYLSSCIRSAEPVAYEDLGCEAVYRLFVEGFPVFRVI